MEIESLICGRHVCIGIDDIRSSAVLQRERRGLR